MSVCMRSSYQYTAAELRSIENLCIKLKLSFLGLVYQNSNQNLFLLTLFKANQNIIKSKNITH
jgi:hypothetical protein